MVDEATKQHTRDRAKAVLKQYSAFEALTENGIELIDKFTDLQISCPWHGADNRPSGRYYANPDPHFHCYTCKLHLNGIGIYAKFRGLNFMQALLDLERRFGIKVPARHEGNVDIDVPPNKSSATYVAEAWGDISRVLEILEKKLLRVRGKATMLDYVKWCRVLDAIQWDLNCNGGNCTPGMTVAMEKIRHMMDSVIENADL